MEEQPLICASLQALNLQTARQDFFGLDAALMTGLGAWDAGPTGDLRVLVDNPEPDSHLAQVGLQKKCITP